jgi:hypothetical protein
VHLAEIYLRCELAHEAEALLTPAIPSSDPEASWRLADVLSAMGRLAEAKEQIQAAQCGFETLLRRHLLAYADHGAEFYIGSGNDPHRAFTLAIVNLENRPTLRAFEQAHEIATSAGLSKEAARILTAARDRWGMTSAFGLSALAETHENP